PLERGGCARTPAGRGRASRRGGRRRPAPPPVRGGDDRRPGRARERRPGDAGRRRAHVRGQARAAGGAGPAVPAVLTRSGPTRRLRTADLGGMTEPRTALPGWGARRVHALVAGLAVVWVVA